MKEGGKFCFTLHVQISIPQFILIFKKIVFLVSNDEKLALERPPYITHAQDDMFLIDRKDNPAAFIDKSIKGSKTFGKVLAASRTLNSKLWFYKKSMRFREFLGEICPEKIYEGKFLEGEVFRIKLSTRNDATNESKLYFIDQEYFWQQKDSKNIFQVEKNSFNLNFLNEISRRMSKGKISSERNSATFLQTEKESSENENSSVVETLSENSDKTESSIMVLKSPSTKIRGKLKQDEFKILNKNLSSLQFQPQSQSSKDRRPVPLHPSVLLRLLWKLG
eukprot:GHVP01005099.1.p1 GENE.GHVP01005099.1~~GHVP01005099.1.p1  ORF type:complete len:278 (+),score=67.02 GHVP01005099.1:434-1267(+)